MKKRIYLSTICALAINLAASDLGTIQVESSTITDLAIDKTTEVSTVNTIDEQLIEEVNAKNINELLQTIPGITADVRSDVVEIHMRGVGQQEFMGETTGVTIVIDGVPVLQNGGKVSFNMDNIESIKVIKGGASYLYGNEALAGAIIINTKKHKNETGADLSVERGSYGYENFQGKAYQSTDNYAVDMLTTYTSEDGYWYKTSSWQKAIGGKFSYYLDDTSDIVFSGDIIRQYAETTRGSVTGVTEAEENPTAVDSDEWSYNSNYYSDLDKYSVGYNKDFGDNNSLQVNTYYYRDAYYYDSSPQDTDLDGSDDAYTNLHDETIEQYGIKTEYRSGGNVLAYMIGLDIGQRSLKETDERVEDYIDQDDNSTYWSGESEYDEGTEEKYAIYAELKYKFTPKFTTVANVRYDYDNYDTTTYATDYNETTDIWTDSIEKDSQAFDNISYRLGTTYSLDKTQMFYANLSTGFRNPTMSQYANNNDLDVQTTMNYEIGTRGNLNYGISYEASLFITDTKDIISYESGTYNRSPRDYANTGDSRNQGIELSMKSKRSETLSFNLAYTYLDAFYTSHDPYIVSGIAEPFDISDNKLPRVPHHKINLIAYYKAMQNLELMSTFYTQSDYYADETNIVKMPGYGKLDLKATYKHKSDMELFVQVKNVFDNQYYRTVYLFKDRNGDGIDAEDASITVDPGRLFYAGLKYKF